mmetsp:Transcript_40039/g.89835  ORF Transcript_40039/g.89835 Transcript_40039/m.89835 type:complete len:530 (-) Transcript_40039:111-1700(-)
MGSLRHSPSPEVWAEWADAVDISSTPSATPGSSPKLLHGRRATAEDKARLEQELECDRRFFANLPDEYVRCPTCNVVYATHNSRPITPSEESTRLRLAPLIPASYSKELPPGSDLDLDIAMRHMHRNRFRCTQCDVDFCRCRATPYHWGWSCEGWEKHVANEAAPSCRWCTKSCMDRLRRSEILVSACCGNDEGTSLERFPPALSCAEKERRGCGRRHECGHWCGGVHGEDRCLPCLHPGCKQAVEGPPVPDGDEWCGICWIEPLRAAPAIQLKCGHVLHQHCAEALVRKGNTGGRRLTFKNIRCPLCQVIMQHASLDALVSSQYALYSKVRRKALQRWVVEQRKPMPRANDPEDEDRIATLAMQKMSFFECSQCGEPYYGGEVECDEEEDIDDEVQAALAMELVCRGCASKGQLSCPEHGTDFLGWKCRYCCEREAHYFCFGTTHFCDVCHDLWQMGVEQRRKLQAGKPCLGKDRCIFGGRHPKDCRNGRDEYALGCTICAQDAECGVVVHKDRRSSRRRPGKICSIS